MLLYSEAPTAVGSRAFGSTPPTRNGALWGTPPHRRLSFSPVAQRLAGKGILEEMGNAGFPPDIVTYNCFLEVLCSLQKADDALKLAERMIEAHCERSVHTFNMLMVLFFEMK